MLEFIGMDSISTSEFLKKKYSDLHTSTAVSAANRDTGEQKPARRIDNYLDRFRHIVETKNAKGDERGLELIKGFFHENHVIKPSQIPESYWENQKRLLRERGQGADLEQVDWNEVKKQNSEAIVADQTKSLDSWIDYLASEDAPYPDWLKYWSMRSVLSLGDYDKEKHSFTKREVTTTKPYPELNREALAYVLDAMQKKYSSREINLDTLEDYDKEQFEKLIKEENFGKLYAWAVEKVTPTSTDRLTITKGRWVKYDQSGDHMPLVNSIQGYGTGWCTAGESTAKTQLQGGDFHVYYSLDGEGKPKIPRVAIRMEGDRIGEVRGIAKDQNMDPYIGEVVSEKMKDFGQEGKSYEKRVHDMKLLTSIETKSRRGEALNRTELVFLYEIDSKIEGFGYSRDPRIDELRKTRDAKVDAPVVLGCNPNEIAWNRRELGRDKKAYIGQLFNGFFDAIPQGLEIYTSFPEGKIRIEDLAIGGENTRQLQDRLQKADIQISGYAKDMLKSSDFTTERKQKGIGTVRLRVQDLGFDSYATTDQLYAKAKELGLELCPAEVGPDLRLKYQDQPNGEWLYIGMQQIADSDGHPNVFELIRHGEELWLYDSLAGPGNEWGPGVGFVFSFRK